MGERDSKKHQREILNPAVKRKTKKRGGKTSKRTDEDVETGDPHLDGGEDEVREKISALDTFPKAHDIKNAKHQSCCLRFYN